MWCSDYQSTSVLFPLFQLHVFFISPFTLLCLCHLHLITHLCWINMNAFSKMCKWSIRVDIRVKHVISRSLYVNAYLSITTYFLLIAPCFLRESLVWGKDTFLLFVLSDFPGNSFFCYFLYLFKEVCFKVTIIFCNNINATLINVKGTNQRKKIFLSHYWSWSPSNKISVS